MPSELSEKSVEFGGGPGEMALPVPYHPYLNSCLVCGGGQEDEDLRRCSGCRSAVYCSRKCQRDDWRVHKRECGLIQVGHL